MHVGIVLGSRFLCSTMGHTADLLARLGIPYETRIITANKNTNRLHDYASNAVDRGLEIIIAGSSGDVNIHEVLASKTQIPVLGVPIKKSNKKKSPTNYTPDKNTENLVRVFNNGSEDAVDAALLAASILAKKHPHIRQKLINYQRQNELADFSQHRSTNVG